MKFLSKISMLLASSIVASTSVPAYAQLVIPPKNQIVSDESKSVSYLVLTPSEKRVRGASLSDFYNDVRNSFTRGAGLPQNTVLLDGIGWDGSVSFKITGAPADVKRSKNRLTQLLRTRGKAGDYTSRVDGIRYPVGPKTRGLNLNEIQYEQWMYDAPGVDMGSANINIPEVTETGSGITVAVIDTGFIQHPDLDMAGGYDFISDDRSSNDDDPGRDDNPQDEGDFQLPEESRRGIFEPSSWHGSHVQGTIAGQVNLSKNYQGIAPDANILSIRVLGRFGGRDQDIVDSIAWAIGEKVGTMDINPNPAKIVNLSLGAESDSCPEYYQDVFEKARDRGVTVVVAAGNDGVDVENFTPANCDNVITVSSNSREGRRANYSNYGSQIDISAPGGETYFRFKEDGKELFRATPRNGVVSTVSSDTTNYTGASDTFIYRPYQGTSMASPVVAGIIALMQEASYNQHTEYLTPDDVLSILKQSASEFSNVGERDLYCDKNKCGDGIVNAGAALSIIRGEGKIISPPQVIKPDEKVPLTDCMTSYEIVNRLLGKDAAEKLGPKPIDHPCDVE